MTWAQKLLMALGALILVAAGMRLAQRSGWFLRMMIRLTVSSYATAAVGLSRQQYSVDLDYSEESIGRLDEILGRLYQAHASGAGPPPEELEQRAKEWGAYLGETIRRRSGGRWVVPTDGPYTGLFVLDISGMQMCPSAKVLKRIMDGPGDSLPAYYSVLRAKLRP